MRTRIQRVLFSVCVVATAAGAQTAPPTAAPATVPKPAPEYRWFAGGAFGLGFGSTFDYVEISPLLGYQVAPKLQLGASLTFRFRNDKRFDPDLSTTDFGASLLARYFVFGPVFLQGEVERLRWEYPVRVDEDSFETVDETTTGLYAGAGFVQQAGRGALYMSFLWDFNYDDSEPTPYDNAFQIRIGYGVRF